MIWQVFFKYNILNACTWLRTNANAVNTGIFFAGSLFLLSNASIKTSPFWESSKIFLWTQWALTFPWSLWVSIAACKMASGCLPYFRRISTLIRSRSLSSCFESWFGILELGWNIKCINYTCAHQNENKGRYYKIFWINIKNQMKMSSFFSFHQIWIRSRKL